MDAGEVPLRPGVDSFRHLAGHLLSLASTPGPVRFVAVDGPGGAGKTTFAGRLAAALDAAVVHTDDFASADNQFDWSARLLRQVVEPLVGGRPGRYQRYDWTTNALAEWHDVGVDPALVIEGVGAARRELAFALTFVVWVSTPPDLRLSRGLQRDGVESASFWQQWIEGENRHFAADRTQERIDLVVDGDPSVDHDPDTEYVRLSRRSW